MEIEEDGSPVTIGLLVLVHVTSFWDGNRGTKGRRTMIWQNSFYAFSFDLGYPLSDDRE